MKPARSGQYKWLLAPLAVLVVLVFGGTPAHADTTHIVRRGENLRRIAVRYGTTVPVVLEANALTNPDLVYAGQRLRIPTIGAGNADTYVVQPGDTLFSIARRLGVSQQTLMQANGISDPTFVWAGQRLQVPGRTISPEPMRQPARRPTSTDQRSYEVATGDTLFSIAARHGVTMDSIVHANGLPAANRIVAGQRLVIPGDGRAPSVAAPAPDKWIDIDVSRQRLVAYEGDSAVFSTTVSTGKASTPTVLGRFALGSKIASQRMTGPGYDLPNVPWVMYFHGPFAIHGTYWHNDFGTPVSHGCVNMPIADAQWLFNWAPAGTPVVVHQ